MSMPLWLEEAPSVGEDRPPNPEVIRPLDEEHVRQQVRRLVDRGARAFVVSLLWSFVNPAHEKAVKRIIREEYRDLVTNHPRVRYPV